MPSTIEQHDKEVLAYHLWHERRCPPGDAETDYYAAEWLLTNFRPYLAVKAALNQAQLAAEIVGKLQESGVTASKVVTVIAVLDGAREYVQARYREAKQTYTGNGEVPKTAADRKDREFYRACYYALLLYGARILEKPPQNSGHDAEQGKPPAERRVYQDACVATFAGDGGPGALGTAIAASLHLCRRLKTINEERGLPWPEQLHARIAIGTTLHAAMSCLSNAWRGDVAVDSESWKSLSPDCRELFFAAGGRVGAITAEAVPGEGLAAETAADHIGTGTPKACGHK